MHGKHVQITTLDDGGGIAHHVMYTPMRVRLGEAACSGVEVAGSEVVGACFAVEVFAYDKRISALEE